MKTYTIIDTWIKSEKYKGVVSANKESEYTFTTIEQDTTQALKKEFLESYSQMYSIKESDIQVKVISENKAFSRYHLRFKIIDKYTIDDIVKILEIK